MECLPVAQARQKQMQLKAQRQAAEDQEESEYIRSLSAREAELSRLEQAHHAAIKAHNAKIKYVMLLCMVCAKLQMRVCYLSSCRNVTGALGFLTSVCVLRLTCKL